MKSVIISLVLLFLLVTGNVYAGEDTNWVQGKLVRVSVDARSVGSGYSLDFQFLQNEIKKSFNKTVISNTGENKYVLNVVLNPVKRLCQPSSINGMDVSYGENLFLGSLTAELKQIRPERQVVFSNTVPYVDHREGWRGHNCKKGGLSSNLEETILAAMDIYSLQVTVSRGGDVDKKILALSQKMQELKTISGFSKGVDIAGLAYVGAINSGLSGLKGAVNIAGSVNYAAISNAHTSYNRQVADINQSFNRVYAHAQQQAVTHRQNAPARASAKTTTVAQRVQSSGNSTQYSRVDDVSSKRVSASLPTETASSTSSVNTTRKLAVDKAADCVAKDQRGVSIDHVPEKYCRYIFNLNTHSLFLKYEDLDAFMSESSTEDGAKSGLINIFKNKAAKVCQSSYHHPATYEKWLVQVIDTRCKSYKRMSTEFFLCEGEATYICGKMSQ